MSQIARPSGVLLSAARQPLLPGGMMNDKANNESVKNPQNKKPDLEAFLKRGLTNEDDIKYVSPGAIPDLDLYMDQITTFMETQLRKSRRYPDDKIMTKTMINNYTKNRLIPPPVKKKFFERQKKAQARFLEAMGPVMTYLQGITDQGASPTQTIYR